MQPKNESEARYRNILQRMLDKDADKGELWEELHDAAVAADGCRVEPDGVCQHGYSSPLLLLGMI